MLTSAGGIIALLQDHPDVKQGVSTEDEIRLKVQLTQFALKKLDIVVDEFWPEISDSIQTIEVFIIQLSAVNTSLSRFPGCLRG